MRKVEVCVISVKRGVWFKVEETLLGVVWFDYYVHKSLFALSAVPAQQVAL